MPVTSTTKFLTSAAFFKALLLGVAAVVGSAWALVHARTHPRVPMIVPIAVVDAAADDVPGEIPAPELEDPSPVNAGASRSP